ncbi:Endonuclease/Exonuclease/phosphatase family protein [Roseimaritima multifibrata]|uniref:Endonuclease/Exonuclease/phosphatase family protein n=1 Tax=Roseimaritima multifibrata TaxID=1930274 RepID=A0A517MC50_9BACT|nr:hypothetical protein [Roseimaritima multifibrata]QDS92464.1 Endonuclease/Exonuclease/phosphatase family protein [Roseimaritima multifibrata]
MPHYYDLLPAQELEERGYPRFVSRMSVSEKKRAIKQVLAIKEHIVASGVPRKQDGNLVFATWNLKEFGQAKKHPEFYCYIAEIMFAFDLVVIQEVRRSIRELQILSNMLGDSWTYVINDVTEGNAGNGERSAILYDTKRVDFSGFSGELVVADGHQIKRTPHITGFITGWKHFSIINVHLDPGNSSTNAAERKGELKRIMNTLEPKVGIGGLGFENIILTGDFNFYPQVDDASVAMLKNDYGFEQVENLSDVDTTLAMNTHTYDRMFIRRDEFFEIAKDKDGNENGRVVEFRTLFESNLITYKAKAKADYESRNPTKTLDDNAYPNYFWVHWLSRQISDHYPIWLEINTDSAVRYLENKLDAL